MNTRLIALVLFVLVAGIAVTMVGLRHFSLPSANVEELYYSNEVQPLPAAEPISLEIGQETYDTQVAEYGELAVRFWADGKSITFLKEFDVTADGNTESIIGLCYLWGNHCPHEIVIVDGDRQIFSTSAGLAILELVEADGNGFYIHWDNEEMRKDGLAEPIGYIKTRFIRKDGQFQPISEEEVLY